MITQATTTRSILVESAKNWFIANGFKLKGPDKIEDAAGDNVSLESIIKCYKIDMTPLNTRGITTELRQDAFDLAFEEILKSNVRSLLSSLAFDQTKVDKGTAELTTFLTAITGSDQEIAVPLAVMKHFIWQVKRKMLCKDIKYPLMPVFFGPQGTGKSMNLKKIIEPLEAYRLKKSVTEIIDPRNFKTLSENYVCFLDEMGRAEMADVELLKAVISDDVVSYRPLYTNRNSTVRQNTTFIGATNRDIRTLIKDPTGMRRFYQIHCRPEAKSQQLWNQLSELDYTSIWQSVDETQDEPEINEWLADLAEHQENIRHQTSIEEFLNESDLKPGAERVSLKDIYQAYDTFCKATNMKPFSRPSFLHELEQLKFEKGRASYGCFVYLNKRLINSNNNKSGMTGV